MLLMVGSCGIQDYSIVLHSLLHFPPVEDVRPLLDAAIAFQDNNYLSGRAVIGIRKSVPTAAQSPSQSHQSQGKEKEMEKGDEGMEDEQEDVLNPPSIPSGMLPSLL